MQKIALITDSACDLDLNTLKENNINLLPLRIISILRQVKGCSYSYWI